jgi:hypothetical protein
MAEPRHTKSKSEHEDPIPATVKIFPWTMSAIWHFTTIHVAEK